MTECIHGLEFALCDICSPKPVAVAAVTRPPTRSAGTAPTTRPAARKPSGAAKAPVRSLAEQRIFHLTHLRNLAGILADDAVLAAATPEVELRSAGERERRASASIGATPLTGFVPFLLTPNATIWQRLRAGETDARLSPEARDAPPAEFVFLITTLGRTAGLTTVVADGDAAAPFTRFGADEDERARIIRRLDEDEAADAELLVADAFPFELVTLIGVAHERARDEVREILRGAAYAPKLAVYPPWFARG